MHTPAADRRGFTLIEVVIALVILASVTLVMASTATRYLSAAVRNREKMQASATAEAQMALVRSFPVYDSLRVKFDSTKTDTPFTGWTRTTRVVRTGTGTAADLTRVTVTVTGPGLTAPITRTLTIAAP